MPNFVKLDPKPYHQDTYTGPEQSEDLSQAESNREKSMSVKLEVENTIRWRWTKDEYGSEVSPRCSYSLGGVSCHDRNENRTVALSGGLMDPLVYYSERSFSTSVKPTNPQLPRVLAKRVLRHHKAFQARPPRRGKA